MTEDHESYKEVAKVKSAQGIKGDLYFLIFSPDFLEAILPLESLRLRNSEGKELELVCEGIRPHKKGFVVTTPDLRDRTQAESLVGSILLLERSRVPHIEDYVGYRVFDGEKDIGCVERVSMDTSQPRIILENGFMVPFVDDLIQEIDDCDRRIVMILPPGLLEAQEA